MCKTLARGKRAVSDPKVSVFHHLGRPMGVQFALSVSNGGNYDVYVANANGGGLRQLTQERSIDTEPQWADNNTIVFTSDRGGQRTALSSLR